MTPLIDVLRSTDGPEITSDATIGELFAQLQNDRRRLVVWHLYHDIAADETVTLRELSEFVTQCEFGDDYSSTERKRVYISLYQHHLDQLAEVGLIERRGEHEYQPGRNVKAAIEILATAEDVCGGTAR